MKTIDEIYQEMLAVFAAETGMELDGAGEQAVRMYALAAQVYGLYEEAAWTKKQCFPQTATGEDLDKHAFLRGLTRSGVTLHKMAEGFDEGDILLQQAIAVDPEETHKSLTDKQRALLPGLVRDLCADLPGLWAAARPQGAGDYWPCPTERDWTIGPDTDLETADKVLRAFYTYEVIYDDGADRWELIDGLLYDGPQPGMLAFPFRGKTICARRARRLST